MRTAEIHVSSLIESGKLRAEFHIRTDNVAFNRRYPHKRIGDLVRQSRLARDPNTLDGEFFYIGLENVESVTGAICNADRVSAEQVQSRSRVFRRGQILYGRLRPYLRKAAVVPPDLQDGLCSTEFIVLEVDEYQMHPHLLREILVCEHITAEVTRMQTGSSLPRISPDDLLDLRIPVPPVKEQLAIVKKLQALSSKRQRLLRDASHCTIKSTAIVADLISSG